MKNNEFIEMCKKKVVEYHNYHQDPVICIDTRNVFTVWYCKTLQNHKALLGVDKPDGGMYYEITYNGDRGEMYIDAYKKEKNICVELCEPQAELGRTVRSMLSHDYRERFRAEYEQLCIRATKLSKMLDKMQAGTLDFKPDCSFEILNRQYNTMNDYIEILEERAKIEGISL